MEVAVCTELPPDCPDDTIAGVADGCFTGYCIPFSECEDLPACDQQLEAECIARPDCDPFYQGIGCTCDDFGCVCEEWVFDQCQPTE